MNRLGDDEYKRPKRTIQDKLTKQDIKDKLKFYVEVEDVYTVPVGSHVRYYSMDKDLFRLGGNLIKKDDDKRYVILANGKKSWSVNTETNVFWKKITLEELAESYEKKIKKLENKNKILMNMIQNV